MENRIRLGALDISATYAAVYTVTLPRAEQVVDPFHCVQLAKRALDEIRRRVQREQKGHRGRRNDPLHRIRRVLLTGEERPDTLAAPRLRSLLQLATPTAKSPSPTASKNDYASSTAAPTSTPPAVT